MDSATWALWATGGLTMAIVALLAWHVTARRGLVIRIARLETQYTAIEAQLNTVLNGNSEILRRQDPLVDMANKLAGALVQVSVRPAPGEPAVTTQIRIEAPDARVQTGGSSFGDSARTGAVAGGTMAINKEPPP